MSGKRRKQGDSLYKVYLDPVTAGALEMYADRLYLYVEDVLEDAVKEFLGGKDLYKLSQKPGRLLNGEVQGKGSSGNRD